MGGQVVGLDEKVNQGVGKGFGVTVFFLNVGQSSLIMKFLEQRAL